ncbi:Outer membrane protein (Porin) [Paraburkholderia unamae]|uniref:porin n=1 Tax=Paraburkholderia unamae TaxID=219649 RepID=UPI001CAE1D46|nr:porin [Paraburkholderia unamae]CAG9275166.1 Outer membrane protein (Porin) [Paraburkholderia unamae]
MKKKLMSNGLVLGAGTTIALSAIAQSSVTVYGSIDTGLAYASSQTALGSTSNGRSVFAMSQGVWNASKFGFLGTEDLTGGMKAIFRLESGINSANGGQQYANAMFGRAAYVGLTQNTFGTLTLGRQYAAYYQALSHYSHTAILTGYFGAHPGDLDGFDTGYRANNTVLYQSPSLFGLTAYVSYSVGGVPGSFNDGSTWAGALQYEIGPIGIATAFQKTNNSNSNGGPWGAASTMSNNGAQLGVSAVTNGYQTARAQQRYAVDGVYRFNSAFDVSIAYSNVQYIPGPQSAFTDTATFNTGGVVLHWKPMPQVDLGAGYSYTRATRANGITSSASYQQFNLSQYYSLSKRTGLYLLEAYGRAGGQTLGTAGKSEVIGATATIGDGFNSTPSSSRSLFAMGVGIVHRF